jgi:hypothetical protein
VSRRGSLGITKWHMAHIAAASNGQQMSKSDGEYSNAGKVIPVTDRDS